LTRQTFNGFIAASVAEGLAPKPVRNLWGTLSLIWNAALAQKYVDAMLPKPKLPHRAKKRARFHAFRHFNVSLLNALRVPLKTIQERAAHALTGVFTLEVCGDLPEWERNLEAGRLAGSEIERAVSKLGN
jgi:hypothetical protein